MNIPCRFSTPITARLLGISIPSLNSLKLPALPYPRVHRRYTREVVEAALGHTITPAEVAAAEAAHAKRRASFVAYNHTTRRKGAQNAA